MQRYGPLTTSVLKRAFWAGQKLRVSSQFLEEEIGNFKYRAISPGRIRVDLDDGTYIGISATLVLHYRPHAEAYKGGIRLSDDVTLDDLQFLAVDMTLKQGGVGVKFGGGKLGIHIPRPKNTFSTKEMFQIVEKVAEQFISIGFLGPNIYVPATDIGTTSEHMDAIQTVYASMKPDDPFPYACVTGKSEDNNGLRVRKIATARGGLKVLGEMREVPDIAKLLGAKTPTMSIQGLGNVGGACARLAAEEGYKVIGVSNSSGAVYNPDGITISELPESPNSPLSHMTGQYMDNGEFLVQPCDILVPAASQNQLTQNNAHKIQAKIVLELANHPTTDEADEILNKRETVIIPDILANAGGVTASWEEYAECKSKPRHRSEIDKINKEATERIDAIMTESTKRVIWYAKKYGETYRNASWLASMDTIAESWVRHRRRLESKNE